METLQSGMHRDSKILFALFFLAMILSIGFVYYHSIVLEDYVVYTDPDAVPDAADFFAYLITAMQSYFQS